METFKKFYRYDIVEYAVTDINGDFVAPAFPNPHVELREFELIKETLKGHWIDNGRWVSKTSKKRYAHPTKAEAINSFIKRNEWRVKILQRQIDTCKIAITIAKGIKIENKFG